MRLSLNHTGFWVLACLSACSYETAPELGHRQSAETRADIEAFVRRLEANGWLAEHPPDATIPRPHEAQYAVSETLRIKHAEEVDAAVARVRALGPGGPNREQGLKDVAAYRALFDMITAPTRVTRVSHDDFLRALNRTFAGFVRERLRSCGNQPFPTIVLAEASDSEVPKSQLWVSRLLQDQWRGSGIRFRGLWFDQMPVGPGTFVLYSDPQVIRDLRERPEEHWLVYADDLVLSGAQALHFLNTTVENLTAVFRGTSHTVRGHVSVALVLPFLAEPKRNDFDYFSGERRPYARFELHYDTLFPTVATLVEKADPSERQAVESVLGESVDTAVARLFGRYPVYLFYLNHKLHDGLAPLPEAVGEVLAGGTLSRYVNPVSFSEDDPYERGNELLQWLIEDGDDPAPYADPRAINGDFWWPQEASEGIEVGPDFREVIGDVDP